MLQTAGTTVRSRRKPFNRLQWISPFSSPPLEAAQSDTHTVTDSFHGYWVLPSSPPSGLVPLLGYSYNPLTWLAPYCLFVTGTGYCLVSSIVWYLVCFRIEFDTHDVLCLVSSIVWYLVCFMIEFDTHDVLCLISSLVWYSVCFVYCIKISFDTWYVVVTFQGYRLGVFMIIVYKAPVSQTTVFKTCYSPNLESADFDRQSFQYTWLNCYFFGSLRESRKTQTYLAIRNYLVVAI